MRKLIERIRNQKGVTMIEYTLIAALIAVAAVTVIGTVGTDINTLFTAVSTAIQGAM